MTTTVYQATTQPAVGTSTVEDMITTSMGYITKTGIGSLKDTAEGTSHDMIQTGVVLMISGAEEDIMVAVTKMVLLEKEPLVFMEGVGDNRTVLLQSREKSESQSQLK
jgi:hypothetical protein